MGLALFGEVPWINYGGVNPQYWRRTPNPCRPGQRTDRPADYGGEGGTCDPGDTWAWRWRGAVGA